MICHVASNDNRFYAAIESAFGNAPAVKARDRLPAVRLRAQQNVERVARRDKIGGRSFPGLPSGIRRYTTFELETYLTGWEGQPEEPGYGALFHAALGNAPVYSDGGVAGEGSDGRTLKFSRPHALAVHQAVVFGGEIRFVSAVVDEQSVILNAPFSRTPTSGEAFGKTLTYYPGEDLPSVTIFDYWTPAETVQRIICGAAVNTMRIRINGDLHGFSFSGQAQDIVDSASFVQGQAGLAGFPEEPVTEAFNYSVVPGNLGQAWLGNTPDRFYTIVTAEVVLNNNVQLRSREFGSELAKCIAAGMRSVTTDFSLYALGDSATKELYQAARQQSPVEVMFQLGEQQGQLCGVYLRNVKLEPPDFDDSEIRLQWRFRGCRAQGQFGDEMVVAFG